MTGDAPTQLTTTDRRPGYMVARNSPDLTGASFSSSRILLSLFSLSSLVPSIIRGIIINFIISSRSPALVRHTHPPLTRATDLTRILTHLLLFATACLPVPFRVSLVRHSLTEDAAECGSLACASRSEPLLLTLLFTLLSRDRITKKEAERHVWHTHCPAHAHSSLLFRCSCECTTLSPSSSRVTSHQGRRGGSQ